MFRGVAAIRGRTPFNPIVVTGSPHPFVTQSRFDRSAVAAVARFRVPIFAGESRSSIFFFYFVLFWGFFKTIFFPNLVLRFFLWESIKFTVYPTHVYTIIIIVIVGDNIIHIYIYRYTQFRHPEHVVFPQQWHLPPGLYIHTCLPAPPFIHSVRLSLPRYIY